jgi:hypothetical protein
MALTSALGFGASRSCLLYFHKADITGRRLDVRKVPEGDIGSATSSRINELRPLWAPSQ